MTPPGPAGGVGPIPSLGGIHSEFIASLLHRAASLPVCSGLSASPRTPSQTEAPAVSGSGALKRSGTMFLITPLITHPLYQSWGPDWCHTFAPDPATPPAASYQVVLVFS